MNHRPRRATRPPNTIIVKTVLPEAWSVELDHLALDLGVSKGALLQDGALLVLRYFSRAEGFGEPMSPAVADMKGVRR